jgi:hypothetical protein
LAGSAPVAQFLGHYECGAFNQLLTQDYEEYSKECAEGIRNSWQAIRNLYASDSAELVDIFKLCSGFNSKNTVDSLIDFLIDVLTNIGMTDYPNPSNFLKPMPAYPMGVSQISTQIR